MEKENPLCVCRCGQRVNSPRARYIQGHQWIGRKRTSGPDYLIHPETGCWLWQHARNPKGYGAKTLPFGSKPRVVVAHRWYYEQAKGTIAEGKQLDHLCREPACVNPDHLEIVSNAENVRRGNSTRLTLEQVVAIKAAPRGYGTGRALARKYDVAESTISAVRRGQNWTA